MSIPFPEPTTPATDDAELFLRYLDYFRESVLARLAALDDAEARTSRLPSGRTPVELVKHLRYVELRWLEWGFQGKDVGDPWGDRLQDSWFVAADETSEGLAEELRSQGARTRAIVETNDLAAVGAPGPRWDGAAPATLERVLFHLMQEYARHLGHLDIVVELAVGPSGD